MGGRIARLPKICPACPDDDSEKPAIFFTFKFILKAKFADKNEFTTDLNLSDTQGHSDK